MVAEQAPQTLYVVVVNMEGWGYTKPFAVCSGMDRALEIAARHSGPGSVEILQMTMDEIEEWGTAPDDAS
ncbi:hypothetical protein [Antarcticirhabdus aurantiaca]|uniref:hypothetical protein n=1 Tax=Antarcticirhabdus aurantiaca TaxID=2606717 RepID=UPI00131B7EA9|nr:hypothetical protein [Antarcticirhabdus aurantiaca]